MNKKPQLIDLLIDLNDKGIKTKSNDEHIDVYINKKTKQKTIIFK